MFIFFKTKFILEAGRSSLALNNSRDNFSQVANVSDALCWGYSVPEPPNTGDKFVLVVWFHYGMQEAQSCYVCKLFHRACFALALIALAGDIEPNPGYQTLDDIRNTRGLKIAHLHMKSRTQD